MKAKLVDASSRPDEENPEWTPDEIRRARPALDMVAEKFGAAAAEGLRRGRGRPPKRKKVLATLRIDPDVLAAYQREGKDWRLRMNQVLREHMPSLEE